MVYRDRGEKLIKQNFLTGEYVIFSKERENRPKCFKKQMWITPVEKCPFCLNNKHMTFEPIYTNYNQEIRIVDNKYPIVKNCKENYGKLH